MRISGWSSDGCSSDLRGIGGTRSARSRGRGLALRPADEIGGREGEGSSDGGLATRLAEPGMGEAVGRHRSAARRERPQAIRFRNPGPAKCVWRGDVVGRTRRARSEAPRLAFTGEAGGGGDRKSKDGWV